MINNAVFCNNKNHKSKGLFCEICNPEQIKQALKNTKKDDKK